MNEEQIVDMVQLAIRSADNKYLSILEEAPIGVYQATVDGHAVYSNGTFAAMLGYDRVEDLMIASSGALNGIYYSEEDRQAHLQRVGGDSEGATLELRMARTDGSYIWASVQTRCVRDKGGEILYHNNFVTDITEKKDLQAEAMRASQLASLGELAAGVAHEINNPLNAVINFAQLLEDDVRSPASADLLKRIILESNRIAAIVRNLLSFARMEHEKFGPVPLAAVVADALELTRAQMEKEGIDIVVDVPAELPEVRGRAQELQQVCINLLSNSRHALNQKYPGQSEDKTLRISAAPASTGHAILLLVRDQGVGIPSAMLAQVFNPFFSTKPKGVGTGLGLSISRKIVETHGGALSISSEAGLFTEVSIILPMWKEEDNG